MNQQPAAAAASGQPDPTDPEPGEHVPGLVPQLGWPVGAVSERLGIAAPTLRSWDRRHGVGPSLRTAGNHRRYTELDIRRVLLMSRLTAQGVPAQSAAESVLGMDSAAIAERLGVDGPGALGPRLDDGRESGHVSDPGEADDSSLGGSEDVVESIVAAARALDTRTMAQLYRRVMRGADVGSAWVEVFAPALRRVGELWQDGRMGVQAEHLTSELLQSELRAVVRANRLRVAGSPVMLASADDEQHHLPLLALEAELSRHGVASLFLGPRVPSEALLSALRESQSRAVFLWASLSRPASETLWRGLEVVDWPLQVVIGGPGWPEAVTVPDGPVTLTRVTGFGAAVEALLPRRGLPSG